MTEYWKSQTRKFCEFCKCWLADNKVSISFHEGGKKHKENVKNHISKLSKKSTKEFKQKEKQEDDIKKMEEAAMAAYAKDVRNNADLTSQNINSMLGAPVPSSSEGPPPPAPAKPLVWHEVATDGGSYYWNTQTNETVWEPPDEYLSLAQQEEQKVKKNIKERQEQQQKKEKQKEKVMEVKAAMFREQMKSLAAPPPAAPAPAPAPAAAPAQLGPAPRASPYGAWSTVHFEEPQQVDLQLPKAREKPPPPVVMEPERVTFKEKRVESLGEGPVEFKKRKFSAKRNMRQKIDDE